MISIVTITFNNYSELLETLKSIQNIPLAQSIVINGGKCEQTREFLKNYPGVVLNESDSGISDAFNKGLKLAAGKGVMFLNSGDTLINPDYIRIADQALDTYDFIHSDIIFNDSLTGQMRMAPARCTLGRGMPYFHQSMVVKKSLMDRVGFFDLQYKIGMDYDYVVRMHALGAKGHYFTEFPTILMDGLGISATQETKGMKECKRSLQSHGMWNLENRFGYCRRVMNYFIRKTLLALKLKPLLVFLKKQKQSLRVNGKL